MNPKEIRQFYQEVGTRIRRARERGDGFSQEALGKYVGLSRTSIVNIEAGRQHVQLYTLKLLADVLNVAIGDFFPQNPSVLPNDQPKPQINAPLNEGDIFSVWRVIRSSQEIRPEYKNENQTTREDTSARIPSVKAPGASRQNRSGSRRQA